MKVSELLPKKKELIPLTDFLNYAKKQGYFVQPENIQHWINEYQEYAKVFRESNN